jgi:lysophospholipase L1-like esterase
VLRCLGKRDTRYDFLQPQRLLGEQLETQGLPYLDLWPALSRYPTSATYTPLDTHWNAFGNQAAAEAIAATLRELRAAQTARDIYSSAPPSAPFVDVLKATTLAAGLCTVGR